LPSWAVVIIGVTVAVVALPIIAAVAIPVFLTARGSAGSGVSGSTTLSLPEEVVGLPKNQAPTVSAGLADLQSWAPERARRASASYGDAGGPQTAVMIYPATWTVDQQQAFSNATLVRARVANVVTLRGPNSTDAMCAEVRGVSTCWTTGVDGGVIASAIGQAPDPGLYPQLIDVRADVTCACPTRSG
jgi:hypothetical protein